MRENETTSDCPRASLVAQIDGKASACNVGEGSVAAPGRSPGEGTGKPLQFSCLENSMDRGAWKAIVHGVEKSRTGLRDFTVTF